MQTKTPKIEKRGTWSDGATRYGTPMLRVFPGCYRTPCGNFMIHSVEYDDGRIAWYWQQGDEDVCDHYDTKTEAVDALCRYIIDLG